MFPQARFIHLVQHPRGYGESVMKYLRERRKLGPVPPNHWLLYLAAYPDEGESAGASADIDPQRAWLALQRNIGEFLDAAREPDAASPRRGHRRRAGARYARRPRLPRPAHRRRAIEEMKHPERSPYACYGPPSAHFGNDRAFLQDPVLRPARAEKHSLEGPLSWRDDGREFSAEVRELARKFGYE